MTQNAAELKFGQLLSTPEDGDEVVISGLHIKKIPKKLYPLIFQNRYIGMFSGFV